MRWTGECVPRATSGGRRAAVDEPRTLTKIGEDKAKVPTNEQNVRRGLCAKLPRPQLPYATMARPRRIVWLAWLLLDRGCAAAIDHGPR